MSDTYTTIGQNLFEIMEELNISSALPEGQETWGVKLNRLPKADEINVYPAFALTPSRDTLDTGDTLTDFDTISFSVYTIVSAHAGDESEAQLRALADLIRQHFRAYRNDPTPIHENAFNMTFGGEWGGFPDQGERWYRLDVTVYLNETLVSE